MSRSCLEATEEIAWLLAEKLRRRAQQGAQKHRKTRFIQALCGILVKIMRAVLCDTALFSGATQPISPAISRFRG